MGDGPTYLITGGAGFIGSHLADYLTGRGDRVVIVDNVSTGTESNISQLVDSGVVEFHRGSIMDETTVRKLVDRSDIVVHLAASVGVKLIVEKPLESLMNNIRGTEIVLEACADLGRKVLIASTSEIYGKNAFGPLSEESDRILGSPYKARWSYSTSKAVDEILAYAYHREKDTPTIVVRLFNCVGPRQTGRYGMVVPSFVRQALQGENLSVYGPGTQQRCFCHVHDTVEGLVSLLDSPSAIGDVFNIGAQHEISIADLAEKIIDLTGSTSQVDFIPYAEAYESGFEDMERRYPDVSKIEATTGWLPRRSLEQILVDTIEYERMQLEPALMA